MSTDTHHFPWHLTLHPSVTRRSADNALPRCIAKKFHPTTAILVRKATQVHGPGKFEAGATQIQNWRARDHRKHRHVDFGPRAARVSRYSKNLWVGILHMARLEYWNVSWWVAQAFTWGSVVWVLNGFFAFMPLLRPDRYATSVTSTGWTAFLGATIFEIGSVFGMWEAWNRDKAASFGWSVAKKFDKVEEDLERVATHKPNHPIAQSSEPSPGFASGSDGSHLEKAQALNPNTPVAHSRPLDTDHSRWIWFSTDTKYFRELGFLAAFFQMIAASVFWISGFTAIPAIQESVSKHTGVLDGVFWTPQVVGGMGFVISASFIMLESQKKWYKPELLSLGWQIGFWNFVGGIGFAACGALGFGATANSGVEYQSILCTFWGSWAFLIGSAFQWYESVNSVQME